MSGNKKIIPWDKVKIVSSRTSLPAFWKPTPGTYSVKISIPEKGFEIKEGKYGKFSPFRLQIDQKEYTWLVTVSVNEKGEIIIPLHSRISQLREIRKKFGHGWHHILIEVKGEKNKRRYYLKHLNTCQCLQGS